MAMSFPVHKIVENPAFFARAGTRLYAMGLLVVTANEAYLLDNQTQHQLRLDPYGNWREWLPQEIPALKGEYLYFDMAVVAGLAREVEGEWVWKYVWQVDVQRGGEWLSSHQHELKLMD